MTRIELLCYDCNRQTKSKLRDENKTNTFLCMLNNFILSKINRQGNKKHILLWLHNLNDFLRSSHPSSFVLDCFV